MKPGFRTQRGPDQQALAERASVHVSQIRRYEADDTAPTLEALRKLALSVSSDSLIFDEHERGPDDELRLQVEATKSLTDEEKTIVKRFLEGVLLATRRGAGRRSQVERAATRSATRGL